VARQGNQDRLDFKIEMMPEQMGSTADIKRKLLSAPIIVKNMAAGRMAEPGIKLVAWGTPRSVGREKKMIIDSR
jgi:hypothetical protein